MPQKWNLQDIKPSGAAKAPRPSSRSHVDMNPRPTARKESAPEFVERDTTPRASYNNSSRRGSKMPTVTIVVVLAIFLFGFVANVLFGGAQVTVYPKVEDVSMQSEFAALLEPQAGDLGYEILSLQSDAEKQVIATGKEEVSERATGTLVVYNTSASEQRLITNTRFESPDGLIFRIKESIVVPAASDTTPGKVSAAVFADGDGEQYNIKPSRFTVPGLKDTDQYDRIYGESAAAFGGGFVGERYIIDETELKTAQEELHAELRNNLLAQLSEKTPAGFIVFNEAVTFTYETLPATESGSSLATIKERAFLKVPIFKADAFAAHLASALVPDYKDDTVYLQDPHTLRFAYVDQSGDIALAERIAFTLEGTAKIIWAFDEEALKSELSGKDKDELASIFARYRSIRNAHAEVRPFWSSSFPDTLSDIHIVPVIE